MIKKMSMHMFLIGLTVVMFVGIPLSIYTISAENRDHYSLMDGFKITAYCPGKCCNGPWAYKTTTGKSMGFYIGRGSNIAATDPSIIPTGARFIYGGKEYTAVDVGGAIKGRRIDLLFYTHDETEVFGVKRNQQVKVIADSMPR